MGFTPREVDQMSLWEFAACVAGFAEFHGGKKRQGRAMTEAQMKQAGIVGCDDGD